MLKLVLIMILATMSFSSSFAQDQAKSYKVRSVYKEQCSAVGGSVNGFCMCTEKLGVIAIAAEVVDVAVTTKKLDKGSFGIINPFMEACEGHKLDSNASATRLEKMLNLSRKYTKNNDVLVEEMRSLDEADMLDPATFSEYLSSTKFRDKMKAKFADLKKRHDLLIKTGTGKTLLIISQEKAKAKAINMIQEITDIDISQAKSLSASVRTAVMSSLERSSEKTIKATVIEMGEKAFKKGAKAMGRGFIAAVISSAAFEGISYVTGMDLTAFDPFEIAFGVTAVADGTMSGAITKAPSLLYYADYNDPFTFSLGLNSGHADTYTGRVALMTMIAEARFNGDSYVHFLDY